MNRITDKHLAGLLARLNRLAGTPLEYCTKQADGSITINVGHFHIARAYGGCQLVQTVTTGGGIRTVIGSGFVPKRAIYDLAYAYLRGLEDSKGGAQ
jgi:hypothetical protein